MWVANGANWFFGAQPEYWNPWMQLIDAGLGAYIPKPFRELRVQADAIAAPASISFFEQDFAQDFSLYRVVAA